MVFKDPKAANEAMLQTAYYTRNKVIFAIAAASLGLTGYGLANMEFTGAGVQPEWAFWDVALGGVAATASVGWLVASFAYWYADIKQENFYESLSFRRDYDL